MKYLNIFKHFQKKVPGTLSTEKLYEEVVPQIVEKYLYRVINISKSDYEIIEKKIKGKTIYNPYRDKHGSSYDYRVDYIHTGYHKDNKKFIRCSLFEDVNVSFLYLGLEYDSFGFKLCIYDCGDYWYLVEGGFKNNDFGNIYFKCDTMEGVIQLIESYPKVLLEANKKMEDGFKNMNQR